MRAYYMTSHKVAMEHILPERRMKLSLYDELNDPFELQPYSLADKDLRRVNRFLQARYFGKKGLMCFSDNWASPVMWAHYADKHHGVCLGFDIPKRGDEDLLFPVVYNPSRLQYVLDHTKDVLGLDQTFIHALIETKSREWSYEREYRVVANLEMLVLVFGFFFVNFVFVFRFCFVF